MNLMFSEIMKVHLNLNEASNRCLKIESSVIGIYAKGMSTRDIAAQINDMYRINASITLVSNITDKVNLMVKEWQNR